MAGAALFRLVDKADSRGRDGGFDSTGLMADDGVDVFRAGDAARRSDDVKQQRLAANFVKDLGATGVETGSLACGHDDDGES
jgi:hypothetical protein